MLTLFYLPACPSCRSVRMLCRDLGIEVQLKHVDLSKREQMTPEFLAMNPFHTVPVLVDDQTGLTLYESRAVMAYIVNKYAPDSGYYPSDAVKRALVDKWLYLICGTIVPSSRPAFRLLYTGGDPHSDVEAMNQMKEKFQTVDEILGKQGTKYVAGDHKTIADFDLLIAVDHPLMLLDLKLPEYPNIHKWYTNLTGEMSFYDEVSVQPVTKTKEIIAQRRAAAETKSTE